MGCLFKSFGIIILFVLLLPVILMLSFFGRNRNITVHRREQNDDTINHTEKEQDTSTVHPDKPIDQSTVEYIAFEEVKDNIVALASDRHPEINHLLNHEMVNGMHLINPGSSNRPVNSNASVALLKIDDGIDVDFRDLTE